MTRAARFVVSAFVLAFLPLQLAAQQDRPASDTHAGSKVLDPGDLAGWKSIRATSWSLDGRVFAYQLSPNEGDAEVVIKILAGGKETRFPVGELPGFGGGGPGGPPGGSALVVSGDGKWVTFLKYPLAKDAKRLRKDRKPIQSSVVIVDVAGGKTREFERVRRFAFDGEKPTIVALHRYADNAAALAASAAGAALPAAPAASSAADLLLVQLNGMQVTHIGDVNEFAFDENGDYLAYTVETRDRFGDGLHLRHARTEVTKVLDSERAVYRRLTWADSGASLAVLRGIPDSAAADTNYSIVAWRDLARAPITYTPSDANGMPTGMRLSAERGPRWSWDRNAVYVGIAERRPAPPGDKANPDVKAVAGAPGAIGLPSGGGARDDEALPTLIIWHGKDSRLQAQQQVEESRDKSFSYLAALRVAEHKLVRLGNDSLRDVTLTARDRYAYGFDVRAYERSGNIDGRRYRDVYAIDPRTGSARLLARKSLGVGFFGGGGAGMVSSPDGGRLLYWSDGNYHVYDLTTGTSRNITEGAPVSFINKEDDHNVDRPPTPVVGWTKDGSAVLLSDNWDVWRVPVQSGSAVNLTMTGKSQGVRFQRRIQIDPKERGIEATKPIYFAIYGERTKKSGIARIDPGKPGGLTLLFEDAQYFASRARDADVWFFTRQTFNEYPDYWTSDGTFKNARRLTEVGAQQKDFAWSADARLIDYISDKGDSLQGALYLPANYEPGKKYPTVVYIYEKLSQGLHAYAVPNETRAFNPSVYTSRGYAVLMPDIVYRVNDPGMSAVWCVVPAVKAAIATGIVDPGNVGLHGHSWGGYQTAFLVTQTNIFKSAIAGAALTDMVSMYSSVYWNTGSANQPIFESSQGRFAGNFIDNYDAYIRNSPAFHAKNVQTPLMLLHNERDGAVDFNQGITYYNTLRQLGKDVLLLQYVGENHGLVQPQNQKDYTIRMKEYFDHYLRASPAPDWLRDGIPRLKMQEHLKSRQKKVAS